MYGCSLEAIQVAIKNPWILIWLLICYRSFLKVIVYFSHQRKGLWLVFITKMILLMTFIHQLKLSVHFLQLRWAHLDEDIWRLVESQTDMHLKPLLNLSFFFPCLVIQTFYHVTCETFAFFPFESALEATDYFYLRYGAI